MKAWVISIYVFCTIALLAVVCYFFPADGIQLGPVHLEFPSIAEVLTPAGADSAMNPMDLLKQRQEELDKLKKMQDKHEQANAKYEQALRENPIAICFPGGDMTLFDDFYAACDSVKAQGGLIRIVHYGDSQIEEDRISYCLREKMQQKFGGQGVGLLPVVQTVPKITVTQRCNPEPRRYMLFGDASLRTKSHHYGPMAQSSPVEGEVDITYYLHKIKEKKAHCSTANRCKVLLGQIDSEEVTLTVNGKTEHVKNDGSIYHAVPFVLKDGTTQVKISLKGSAEVLGVMLDGQQGVAVDNIPMRGCTGLIFPSIAKAQFAPYMRDENVRMVILEYGGNILPAMRNQDNLNAYHDQMVRVIHYIKEQAPNACVLFIGPSDMATRVKGELQSYPMLEPMIETLKKVCADAGAAYWDLYAVMGGHNSMIQWAQAQPALAGKDYVHFTHAGAEKVGDLLYQSLMLNYDYYKMRQKQLTENK